MHHAKQFARLRPRPELQAKAQALRLSVPSLGDRTLLRVEEAADLTGIRPGLLARWRCAEEGPAYFKIGRTVLYDLNSLVAFVEERRNLVEEMAAWEQPGECSPISPASPLFREPMERAAILIAQGHFTFSGVAKKIGVTPQTLRNWRTDERFAARVDYLRAERDGK